MLEEAGAKGLPVKEIVQLIKERKLWDWKDVKRPVESVRRTCDINLGIFAKIAPGTYVLQSLQGESDGSSHSLPKNKARDEVETRACRLRV